MNADMYEVVAYTPKDVFLMYTAIMLSIVIVYPIIRVFMYAAGGVLNKWK